MLTIEYINTGKAYSDFEIDEKAKEIIETHLNYLLEQDMIYRTSTENLIDAVRLYVVQNKINPEKWLQFKHGEEIMSVNQFGNPDRWVIGFCDSLQKRLGKIVRAQAALRKERI